MDNLLKFNPRTLRPQFRKAPAQSASSRMVDKPEVEISSKPTSGPEQPTVCP
jgi:hypothetical protein